MRVNVILTVEVEQQAYSESKGIPTQEVAQNVAAEFTMMTDALTWHVVSSGLHPLYDEHTCDVVQTILARPQSGSGGGIPLTRGEVAMLFLDGYAGDGPGLLDIRSQGYGEDNDWDGLTTEDVLEDEDTAFVWTKWEPLELWPELAVEGAILR